MPNRRQGIFWIITLSCALQGDPPSLQPEVVWIKGQKELGQGGFEHWQFIIALGRKGTHRVVQRLYPGCHSELTRSLAAESYVWKEDTRVEGSQFEGGAKPIQRSSHVDWENVWKCATIGDLLTIPASIRVSSYRTLRNISADHQKPVGIERICNVYHGPTGTGKSRRAWEEGTLDAYPKDPRTKFWCGYDGQLNVIIDEFRGGIDIAHLLRWLDRYPVIVEVKGSSVCLRATNIWITSNLPPSEWYPGLDDDTLEALMRRLVVTSFHNLI